jgi:hypothetical protein
MLVLVVDAGPARRIVFACDGGAVNAAVEERRTLNPA